MQKITIIDIIKMRMLDIVTFILLSVFLGTFYSIIPYISYIAYDDFVIAPIVAFILSFIVFYYTRFYYIFSTCTAFILAAGLSILWDFLWSEGNAWFQTYMFSRQYVIFIAPTGIVVSLIIAIIVTLINRNNPHI